MLSRRGLRIKAMQVLYMVQQSGGMEMPAAEMQLQQSINNAFKAYLYNLNFIIQLAQQVDLDAHRKLNKYLPTQEDKNFSTRFFKNTAIQFLINNQYFQQKLKREKLLTLLDEEVIHVIYNQLKEFAPYQKYILQNTNQAQDDIRILKKIFFEFLFVNEYYDQHMEDIIPTWADDEHIVEGLLEDILKNMPFGAQKEKYFFEFNITSEEEQFASTLVKKTLLENAGFDKLIEPKLQNWELDRVSVIDRILMKMALTEFLYLPTIPVKVTINEYLDISKIYSTPKSKEFINGVLDNIMLELKGNGTIVKTGRGLIE